MGEKPSKDQLTDHSKAPGTLIPSSTCSFVDVTLRVVVLIRTQWTLQTEI